MSARDIATLKEVIKKLVPMLGKRGLRVTQVGTQAYVIHNKRGEPEVVNIPNLPDDADRELILAIQGFIDHEVGHVLHTDAAARFASRKDGTANAEGRGITAEQAAKRLDNLHNIIEDPFVERKMREMFPGSAYNLDNLFKLFIERMTLPALKEAEAKNDTMKKFQILLVPAMRAIAGQQFFQKFMDDNKHWDYPLIKALMDQITPDLAKRIANPKNSWDTLSAATDIFCILHPKLPPAPPPPPAPPQDPDDEDEEEQNSDSSSSKSGGKGSNTEKEEDEDDKGSAGEKADEDQDSEGEPSDGAEGEGDGEQKDEEDEKKDEKNDGAEKEDDDQSGADGDEDADSDDPESNEAEEENDGASQPEADDDGEDGEGAESDASEGNEAADDGNDEDKEDGSGTDADSDEADSDEAEEEGESKGGGGESEDAGDGDASDAEAAGASEDDGAVTEQDGVGQAEADELTAGEKDEANSQAGIGSSPFIGIEMDELEDAKALGEAISDIITDEAVRECRDADYTVYTTDDDFFEPMKVDDRNYEPRMLETLENETGHMVGPMQKDIERMMAARSQIVQVPGFRSGRLHAGSLYRLKNNDDRVFRRRQENKSKKTAVVLLIDNSGSMSGEKMEIAMAAGFALSQTLERVGIPNMVFGFTTGSMQRGSWEKLQEEVNRLGKYPSRVEPLHMPIYKKFEERLTPEVKKRFAYARAGYARMASNIDGECVRTAGRELDKRTEDRKVLLVLSDGNPAGGTCSARELHADLHRAVKECGQKKIDCIGLGILDRNVKRYYPKSVVLDQLNDLPKAVMGELKQILGVN